MTPDDFVRWRHKLRLTKRLAARLLGVSDRTVFNYERSTARTVPTMVALACEAITRAFEDIQSGNSACGEASLFALQRFNQQ